MNNFDNSNITKLLDDWSDGNDNALGKLMPLVYDELRRMAKRYMQSQPSGHTLDEVDGIEVYFANSQKSERLTNFGESPIWLKDNCRLIFFAKDKIFLLDTQTFKTKELISVAPTENLQGITISPDNRFIYFSLQKQESNIWLASVE